MQSAAKAATAPFTRDDGFIDNQLVRRAVDREYALRLDR